MFDVGVETELANHASRPGKAGGRLKKDAMGTNTKRQRKNDKYGFGGKKRHSKSGDALSSGDISGFNARKMKAGAKGK